jgi:hypothetical protein
MGVAMSIGRKERARRTMVALTAGLVAVSAAVPAASASAGDQAGRGLGEGRYPYAGSIEIDSPTNPGTCDPLGGERCLLPFPNDYFTVRDRSTETGRRVDLGPDATPANAAGVHIDPTELNRNDGFSPGSAIVALLPGIDLAGSGAAPITDMGSSLDRDAPFVVIDAKSGKRHPYWAELDSRAPDDAHRLLFVRPAENFREGHRYIVAVRDVVDAAGQPIEPSDVFRAYRDRLDTGIDAIESRRAHMDDLFRRLRAVGVDREGLVLAWDFTVASRENLSERLLAMRDDAFRQLGSAAPRFTVTSNVPSTRANLAREVSGTFEVPNYLTGSGEPGAVLNNGTGPESSPIPIRNGTYTARFICAIPSSAVGADGTANPTRMMLYGHGLLGSAREALGASSRYARVTNTTTCATWWIGMSEDDIGVVLRALGDMSAFRSVPDRLQQSMLNFLFLGRLMKHPHGFSSDPAFQAAGGTPLLDQRNLTFNGVSQGGILGGALTAVAQDWKRSFLGVPAMNYSTLLDRSVDFDPFGVVFDPNYPDWVDRQLAILLAQMLWDRGENDGYAQHLTENPYRHTPKHRVMLFEAFGDHQVANVATEVMARTIGAELRAPGLAPGRSPDVQPFWGIDTTKRLPDSHGSYLVVWDFGTPAPPLGNLPNRAGADPHGQGRDQLEVLTLASTFLEQGELVDTCGGGPCQTEPPPG